MQEILWKGEGGGFGTSIKDGRGVQARLMARDVFSYVQCKSNKRGEMGQNTSLLKCELLSSM